MDNIIGHVMNQAENLRLVSWPKTLHLVMDGNEDIALKIQVVEIHVW